uniref:Uncharacterized protein n=1 Tax=Eutreptiella gymnastica TaxID=73025 RepID=A0A7S4D1D7_9EUGL
MVLVVYSSAYSVPRRSEGLLRLFWYAVRMDANCASVTVCARQVPNVALPVVCARRLNENMGLVDRRTFGFPSTSRHVLHPYSPPEHCMRNPCEIEIMYFSLLFLGAPFTVFHPSSGNSQIGYQQ